VEECGFPYWEAFGDHCYHWTTYFKGVKLQGVPKKRSWNQAEQWCQDISFSGLSHLASVTSDAIHQYVLEGMKRRGLDFVWLGGTDKDEEGTWKWADGSPFEFTNWLWGEPNNWIGNGPREDEDCMYMETFLRLNRTEDRGKWNELRCDKKLHFLCAQKSCQTRYTAPFV